MMPPQTFIKAFLLIVTLFPATLSFGARITESNFTGTLPRGQTEPTQFSLTIKVTEITKARVDEAKASTSDDPGNSPIDWLDLRVQDDSNEFQKQASCPDKDGISKDLYFELNGSVIEDIDSAGRVELTYNITVKQCSNPAEALSKKISNGLLLVTAEFDVGGGENTQQDQTIKAQIFIIKPDDDNRPSFDSTAAIGTNKRVVVKWNTTATNLATINDTKGSAGDNFTPETINIVAFPLDAAPGTLPSRKFDPSQSVDPAGDACTFVAQTDCVTCPDDNLTYVDFDGITGATKTSQTYTSGSVSLGGLDNDKEYIIFLQYQPGSKASTCVQAQPSPNFTLTELNGEGEAEIVSVRCFIATAAYGTPLDDRLIRFRQFRDQVLVDYWLGRAFLKAYYTLSPPMADFIAERPWLKQLTRYALEVPATLLQWWWEPEEVN